MNYNEIIDYIKSLKDEEYLKFSKKITFTDYEMIGVRIPLLRSLSTKISKEDMFFYLDTVKREYFEEVLLEGLLIGKIKDYETFIKYFNNFILYIDNWAICDMALSSMKIISKNKELMLKEVKNYLNSDREFIVRVGVVILMDYYLDDEYINLVFDYISNIKLDKYYVNMAIAWLLSRAYINYNDLVYKLLESDKLSNTIINMTIQKIRDSRRVSTLDKEKITKLKRTNK